MNKVVQNALTSLTNTINMTSGLMHPSDKEAAVDLFKILKNNDELYSPNEVENWALQNGWNSKYASDLRKISDGILQGKNLRGKDFWNSKIIDIWRK